MSEGMEQFRELRRRFPKFVYRGYHCDCDDDSMPGGTCRIRYDFEIPGLSEFHPSWEFPVRRALNDAPRAVLDELVFQLGLVECISYYKLTCAPTVEVVCGSLTDDQRLWWRKLYYNGLGEFMYRNGIEVPEEELLHIEAPSPRERGGVRPYRDETEYTGFLVPVGGGKDSVVTLETLRGQDIMTYHINDDSAITEVIEVFHGNARIHRRSGAERRACADVPAAAGVRGISGTGDAGERTDSPRENAAPRAYADCDCQARRTLDRNMLELNRQGYLNGHTPFSAIVAFSSMIAAFLNGRKYIALSNETSADETTVRGSFVNHQYSKSYEFEEDFRNYIGQLVTSDIHYFSYLRPLAEIQIAGLFAQCRAYHPVFLSCNRGSKKGIWCCDCPKCLFVYIILTPFLTEEELAAIFGEKLLDRPSLDKDFRELVGIDENKPFECVGTRGEVAAALKAFLRRGGHSLLTDRYREAILACPEELSEYMSGWARNHVPEEYAAILRRRVEELARAQRE